MADLATAVRMQGGGQSPQQGRNAPGTDPACPPLPPSGAKTEIRPLTTRSRHLLTTLSPECARRRSRSMIIIPAPTMNTIPGNRSPNGAPAKKNQPGAKGTGMPKYSKGETLPGSASRQEMARLRTPIPPMAPTITNRPASAGPYRLGNPRQKATELPPHQRSRRKPHPIAGFRYAGRATVSISRAGRRRPCRHRASHCRAKSASC